MKILFTILFLLLSCPFSSYGGLTLPHIISDHMMLQRDKPARIWGQGDDGTQVTVRFKDQSKSTVVKNGQWLVELEPETHGGPFDMTITHGTESKLIQNILIGEVWQASGQSNMQMTLMGMTDGMTVVEEPPNDQIRLFKQDRQVAADPKLDTLPAKWAPANSASRRHFSAVAYYFARDLQQALDVPVGITLACDGGTKTQFWTPIEAFAGKPEFAETLIEAQQARQNFGTLEAKFEADKVEYFRKRNAGEKTGAHPTFFGRVPCAYYNGMIHPIRNYTIRGVIWYQGERNSITTQDSIDYKRYLPLMITAWREAFRNPDMPFHFVQMPIMTERNPRDLAPTRESQTRTEKNLPHTGMVVTLDIDEPDLHPKVKRPIGERLANLARARVYGHDVEYTSPRYERAEIQGAKIVLHFTHVGQGFMVKDGPRINAFTICGADQKFVAAEARIIGETIHVSSPAVPQPVAVRYAWRNHPQINLFRQERATGWNVSHGRLYLAA